MDFQDIIIKKRDKQKLTKEEISFFIHGVTDGSLPDYQISALLMAILLNGMDAEETAQMTMEMAHSGALFDLSSLPGFKVDKHSTGGVGDTTTLILAPLVASLGVPVVKMSGRGLGFSGGTIDKLESIPGFQVGVTEEDALTYGKTSHLVLMSQTDNLTPADKKLYALRDVTGTVDSIPLIAASIMSKKIAAGADGIVLDVKCGSGAFMKTQKDAEALAHIMVEMGQHVGRKVTAIISGMDQPLGMYIGNSLEVMEAMEVLKGNVKGDLLEVSLLLGAHMLLLAGRVQTEAEGKALLQQQIDNGAGIAKFRELLIQQGGNPAIIEQPDFLPLSPCSLEVKAEKKRLSHPHGYRKNRACISGNRRRTGFQGTASGFRCRHHHQKTPWRLCGSWRSTGSHLQRHRQSLCISGGNFPVRTDHLGRKSTSAAIGFEHHFGIKQTFI